MEVKITENDWIEYYEDGKKIRRKQTLDEYLEWHCECCLEKECTHEAHINTYDRDEEDVIMLCKDCAKEIATNIMDIPKFNQITIMTI